MLLMYVQTTKVSAEPQHYAKPAIVLPELL